LFDLENRKERVKMVEGRVVNPLDLRLMPREVVVMTQRLHRASVVGRGNAGKEDVLEKMRVVMNRQPGEELIDP
jgi:Holliday junction resolvasome RuvABC endonuclease subunit